MLWLGKAFLPGSIWRWPKMTRLRLHFGKRSHILASEGDDPKTAEIRGGRGVPAAGPQAPLVQDSSWEKGL